mmetsp:Transcript_22180/g.21411  ORF Transcript_22180/g.21411 Transcript_22180/m.21411 type:complete len:328 (-) Transcript_22180:2301-3284(-)
MGAFITRLNRAKGTAPISIKQVPIVALYCALVLAVSTYLSAGVRPKGVSAGALEVILKSAGRAAAVPIDHIAIVTHVIPIVQAIPTKLIAGISESMTTSVTGVAPLHLTGCITTISTNQVPIITLLIVEYSVVTAHRSANIRLGRNPSGTHPATLDPAKRITTISRDPGSIITLIPIDIVPPVDSVHILVGVSASVLSVGIATDLLALISLPKVRVQALIPTIHSAGGQIGHWIIGDSPRTPIIAQKEIVHIAIVTFELAHVPRVPTHLVAAILHSHAPLSTLPPFLHLAVFIAPIKRGQVSIHAGVGPEITVLAAANLCADFWLDD